MKTAETQRPAPASRAVAGTATPAPKNAQGSQPVEYTCPMHPAVRQPAPGDCPICGMSLEPVVAAAQTGNSPERRDMTRRLWIGAAFALPVFVLEMSGHLFDLHRLIGAQASNWVQLVLATPVVLWAGWPFFQRAAASLKHRSLNMFTLVALGTGVAWLYSMIGTLVPQFFPLAFRGLDSAVPVYFEAAAMITVLVLLGQVLELRAREKTSGAIRALLDLAPKQALRVRPDGSDETVALADVQVGDLLRVRPGEKLPVDGELTEGGGRVDESMITGEPMPVAKAPGAKLTAGTINQTGGFVMRAQKVGADTLLAQIVQMVSTAQHSHAPIQGIADRVAGWFVPIVIGVAAITFVAWMVWGPAPAFSHALIAAVAVLIIACPCALGLATPMSIMVGMGRGAQSGVLIRDAAALERLEKLDTVVVDKTGTLTEGHPKVVKVEVVEGVDADALVQKLASVEQSSEHPLGAAVVAEAASRGLALSPVTDFDSPLGKGVTGTVDGVRLLCGSAAFLAENQIDASRLKVPADAVSAQAASVVYVAIAGHLAGFVGIADPVKASSAAAVAALRNENIRVVMLTGDAKTTAEAVGRTLGVDEVIADVLPQDKAAVIDRLIGAGKVVAMVGDGVNDAPALAAADVGIAMGTGTDVAMESASVTLLRGDLMGILVARQLSRLTMRNIRLNLWFAFVYNAAGLPVAAGVLYPWFGILLSPEVAAAAMALSSVSVIANSLRLRSSKLAA